MYWLGTVKIIFRQCVSVHYNAHELILKFVACFVFLLLASRVCVTQTYRSYRWSVDHIQYTFANLKLQYSNGVHCEAESSVRLQQRISAYLCGMPDDLIPREFLAWGLLGEWSTKYVAEHKGNVHREYFELFVIRWYCVFAETQYMTRFWVVNGRI